LSKERKVKQQMFSLKKIEVVEVALQKFTSLKTPKSEQSLVGGGDDRWRPFFFKGILMTQLLKSEIITKFPEEGTWDLFPNLRMVGDSSKITDLGTKRRIFFKMHY